MQLARSVFLAHLPAGYLITRRVGRGRAAGFLRLGLLASVVPDLDLVRFYLLDHRRVLHHAYWTHEPFWWALLAAAWFGLARLRGSRAWVAPGKVFFANVLAHLALDTVTGRIRWLAPFCDRAFGLVVVPARQSWWVSSFLLHWTFLLELAITTCALWALLTRAGGPRSESGMGQVGVTTSPDRASLPAPVSLDPLPSAPTVDSPSRRSDDALP